MKSSAFVVASLFSMAQALPDESVLRNFDSRDGALVTHCHEVA